jgi:hypothetical protein
MTTNQWNPVFAQNAEFESVVTIASWPATYPALATATDWRLTVSQPDAAAFVTATTANYITLNVAKTAGTIKIPASVTGAFPLGHCRLDLDILFPSSVVKRVISLGSAQVNTYAGAT